MADGYLRRQRASATVAATLAIGISIAAGAACGGGITTPPTSPVSSPTASPRASPTPTAGTGIEVRQLVQQSLAVGMASNVLQSQLAMVEGVMGDGGTGSCNALTSGTGSSELISKTATGQQTDVDFNLYYDTACANPYIRSSATVTAGTSGFAFTITDQSDYVGPSGVALGALKLNESVAGVNSGGQLSSLELYGAGTFMPDSGAPAVSLGLTCAIPASESTPPPFPCSGGIAQSFPDVGVSLGDVTTLNLTLVSETGNQYRADLASSTATLEKGSLGALSITVPTPTIPVLAGEGSVVGSDVVTGDAASFSLFPPTPTGWTVTDQADGISFSLQVTDNTSGDLTGNVTTAGGVQLAQMAIDRSGTGSLTYAGGAHTAVTNWTLAG